MRIDPSFLSRSKIKLTKNVEFASTFKIVFYFLNLSSYILGWFGLLVVTRSLTPSESGFASSRDSSFTSKKKLMFEQFLNGIFIAPLEGILMILNPVFSFTIYLRQTMLGTSPRLLIGNTSGVKLSTCRIKSPLISVDTSSSGMLALIMIGRGSFSLMGTSMCVTSSPPSTNLKVKTSPWSFRLVSTLIESK